MGISGNADVRLGLYLFGKCGCEWIGHGNGKLQMADSGKLIPMVREGRISEEVINEKVRRIYRSCMEMGFFDRPQKKENIPSFNLKANRMALEVAQEGIVLLKNKDKLLPLNANEVKNIAVIGPNACYNLINDVKIQFLLSVMGEEVAQGFILGMWYHR